MTREEANELIKMINNYIFNNKYSNKEIFELLSKYKKEFPKDCFYLGEVFYKKENSVKFNTPVVCLKERNKIPNLINNKEIWYRSLSKSGFDLYNVILYILENYKIENLDYYHNELLTKIDNEKKILCYINKFNQRKIKEVNNKLKKKKCRLCIINKKIKEYQKLFSNNLDDIIKRVMNDIKLSDEELNKIKEEKSFLLSKGINVIDVKENNTFYAEAIAILYNTRDKIILNTISLALSIISTILAVISLLN